MKRDLNDQSVLVCKIESHSDKIELRAKYLRARFAAKSSWEDVILHSPFDGVRQRNAVKIDTTNNNREG